MMSRLRTAKRTTLLAGCCLAALPFGLSATAQSSDPVAVSMSGAKSATSDILLLEPWLNGAQPGSAIFVLKRAHEIWLPRDYLDAHAIGGSARGEDFAGREFVRAQSISSLAAHVDVDAGRIEIRCGATCFRGATLSAGTSGSGVSSPVEPGGFVNYDVFAEARDGGRSAGGLVEGGVFSSWGTGHSSAFCTRRETRTRCGRLETNWTIDDPVHVRRLVLGDSTTQAARWGAPARFGGIRWGTDFSLRPDFVTFPTPVLEGESTLSSSVEIYINDALRFQTQTPAGPFRITEIPVVSGEGEMRTVVRDLLGREQSVVTQFYAAPQLLRSGLGQYSIEAGFLRENFGVDSGSYGEPFVAMEYDRGLSDRLTLGLRSELGERRRTLGMSASLAHVTLGVSEGALAVSDSDGRTGLLARFSQEYHSPLVTLGGAIDVATKDFRQFGSERPPPRVLSNSFVGFNNGDFGAASLSWTFRDEWEAPDFSVIGMHYSSRLLGASVLLSGLRTVASEAAYTASLTVSFPFGGGGSASSTVDHDGKRFGLDLSARDDPPTSGGVGYHVRAAKDGAERYEGGVIARSAFGEAALDFSRFNQTTALRLSARGGVATLDGEWLAAPSIGGGVAVVSVGREPGVQVFHDRQPVGVTDREGRVVIPGLRSFERNVISFEVDDLELAANFDRSELVITPGFRTGHVAAFKVARPFNLIAQLRDEAGEPLPVGELVVNVETGETYPVGSSGMIYIPDAGPETRLSYHRDSLRCDATVVAPTSPLQTALWDAGPHVCRTPPGAAVP